MAKAAQLARPGGRQPNDAAISVTAKKLGFTRAEISRAKLIAGIAPSVQAKLAKSGLDDDQAALVAIAKASTPKAQRKKLREIVKRKNAPRGSAGAPIAPATISPPTVPTQDETAEGISSPVIASVLPVISDDLDIPPVLDRRDPETAFVALKAAWDHASIAVRSRFAAEVLGISGDFPGRQTEHP